MVPRARQRDHVDQLVRERRRGLVLLAVQVQVLNLARGVLEPVALDQLVVEVLLARAHAADVQREEVAHPIAGRRPVVGDVRVDGRRHVEIGERAPGPRGAFLEQRAHLAHVLGREEDRQPAVGDLSGQRGVLGPDRRQVDRDPLLDRGDHQLERLARPIGEGQLERLAVELDALARQRHPEHRHVLARALQLVGEALSVPPLGHLRPRGAEAEQHPTAREHVDRGRGHGGHPRAPRRNLEDRRPEPDPARARGQPGQHGGGVGTVGLGRPDRVIAEPLGLLDDGQVVGRRHAGNQVAEVHAELHGRPEPYRRTPRPAILTG